MKTIFFALLLLGSLHAQEKTATFGGGCFWCMEAVFQPLKGVYSADSGYMGGNPNQANYKDVSKGHSGHYEVIQVRYESTIISYKELLDVFWRNIDPLDKDGQFYDKGKQYQTIVFYQSSKQKNIAKASKEALAKSGRFSGEIATKIKPAKEFFKAEEYHQDYFKKNSLRYQMYKKGSGRDKYLSKTWK